MNKEQEETYRKVWKEFYNQFYTEKGQRKNDNKVIGSPLHFGLYCVEKYKKGELK